MIVKIADDLSTVIVMSDIGRRGKIQKGEEIGEEGGGD
jgi:hypothetical protein